MRSKIKHLIFLFFAPAVIFSCKKEQEKPVDPNPNPSPVIGKLAKLRYSNGSYDSLYYNSDGTIARLVVYNNFPGPYTERYSFEYDTQKKVTRILQDNGERYDYTYINGQLTAVSHFVNGQKRDFRFYDYVNGKLAEVEEYYQTDPGQTGWGYLAHRSYTYYPDGNLKDETSYSFDTVTRMPRKDLTITYEDYDGNFNSIEVLGRFLYLSQQELAKNNARKLVSKDEVNGSSTSFSFTYTYNEFRNPLTRTMQYQSAGSTVTETVQYSYY
jgi:antitoxin component YwqK of YwqJK toxin-antitoxin module